MKETAVSPPASNPYLDLLRSYRRFELFSVLRFLPEHGKVCELGGGDGFQAALLAAAGYQVRSFDTRPSPAEQLLHSVSEYDGRNLPLPDESFDAVFSSSVLEHVVDLDSLIAEQQRILRPGGVAIHIMPNHLWRLMTSITHYPYLLKRAFSRQPSFSHAGASGRRRTPGWYLARILAAPPHGNGRSALAELYTFSPASWKKRLAHSDFRLEDCFGAGLFYSGNALLPRLPFSWRQWMGSNIGSVCTVYVLRKTTHR